MSPNNMITKAQSAVELTLIITFMFLVFFIFFLVVGSKMADVQKDENRQLLEDLTKIIKEEIVLASNVEDGYFRTFEIPQALTGLNFNMSLLRETGVNHTELVITFVNYTDDVSYIERLPKNITGNLSKGINNISKKKGVICLNIATCP